MMSEQNWKSVFYMIAAIAILFFFFLVVTGRDGQFLTLLAAVVCLFATRFADVIKLKLSPGGLEAEMKAVIDDARATIGQLHLLAEEFTKFTLEMIQAEGRWGGGFKGDNKKTIRDKMVALLRELGVPPDRIKEIEAVENPCVHFDYAQYVVHGLESDLNGDQRARWTDFYSHTRRKGIGYEPTPDELERFLTETNLLKADASERLADYRHWHLHNAHRRPDEWANRNRG